LLRNLFWCNLAFFPDLANLPLFQDPGSTTSSRVKEEGTDADADADAETEPGAEMRPPVRFAEYFGMERMIR
jgi:hypothetical protein